jgi:nucleoside-diphosphate-sugar epimerase
MKVLYIGGTGEISYECLLRSVAAGHECTLFNRGRDPEPLPAGVRRIVGDMTSQADYDGLGRELFDVVCQFRAYTSDDCQKDLKLFGGRCGQYVFISTASAYQKPPAQGRITEQTPLANPFWEYSRQKARAESLLLDAHREGQLPVTIVRPSLTYRRRFPGTFASGDDWGWRMLAGRPVIVQGDGQALWTYTHARDFAAMFVPLLGNTQALGEAYQIMTDTAYTWEYLFRAVGRTLGVEPKLTFVPTQTLVRYKPEWAGPLLGDKSWASLFDTTKIEQVSGRIAEPVPLTEGFRDVLPRFRERMKNFAPDAALHALLDHIAREQNSLGSSGTPD